MVILGDGGPDMGKERYEKLVLLGGKGSQG